MPTRHIDAVLRAIPPHKDRDRLLFTLLSTTGMRIGEALAIDVDGLDLTHDDEHVTALAKGGRRCTILLDDPTLVCLLRRYLKARGYRHGPLFRAEKNYVGGPLRYASAQQLWAKYCTKAHVDASIHQLRHAHATELQRRSLAGDHPTLPGPRERPDGPAIRRSARCHDRRRDPFLAPPKEHQALGRLTSPDPNGLRPGALEVRQYCGTRGGGCDGRVLRQGWLSGTRGSARVQSSNTARIALSTCSICSGDAVPSCSVSCRLSGRSTSSAKAHPWSPSETASSESGGSATTCMAKQYGMRSLSFTTSELTTRRVVDCPARWMTGSKR
ncbi:MAG: site-specific integrase [Pseudonocardiales bacterium]|nr:site-specific integrase [Pseudonocardiales bacterium]